MKPTTNARILSRGMFLLRTYIGLVFLSNGLAKLFDFSTIKFGNWFSAGLIDSASAQRMLLHASMTTTIAPLGAVARWVASDAYSVFGPLLTIAELALGLGMLTGILVRWAAIGGLLLMVPVWIMIWPTHDYLWDYPGDLFPLFIFAVAPVPSRLWLSILGRIKTRLGRNELVPEGDVKVADDSR